MQPFYYDMSYHGQVYYLDIYHRIGKTLRTDNVPAIYFDSEELAISIERRGVDGS